MTESVGLPVKTEIGGVTYNGHYSAEGNSVTVHLNGRQKSDWSVGIDTEVLAILVFRRLARESLPDSVIVFLERGHGMERPVP